MPDTAAFTHWESLVAWWSARRTEHDTIGRKLAPRKANPSTLDAAKARMAADNKRPQTPPPAKPDEGAEVADTDVAALKARYGKLAPAAKAWTGAIVAQGNDGHTWRINEGQPTVRRYELYRGVLTLAEWGDGQPLLNDIVRAIIGNHTDTPPGHLLGELDAQQAAEFATKAVNITLDKIALTYTEDGTPQLQPVA